MFTKDEKNLEKYIDVHIFLPAFTGEKWVKFLDLSLGKLIKSNKQKIDDMDLAGFNDQLPTLFEYLESILDTPRKMKSMCRHLDEKLSTPASTIFLIDLIFLSSIQATNPRLFQWISNNRLLLVDPNTASHEAWAINTITKRDKEESRSETCKIILTDLNYSTNEINLVMRLFFIPGEKDGSKKGSEKEERSVKKNQYYLNYFLRDALPIIGTVSGANKFLKLVKDKSVPVESVYRFLLVDYEKHDRQDLREIILSDVKVWIAELEREDSYRLLVAFGMVSRIIPDDGFIYHPKSVAAFSAWDFLEKKISSSSEFVEYVMKIFSEEISHKFYTVLVFYIFTKDQERKRDPFSISEAEKKTIGDGFNSRCMKILFTDEGIPRNLFEKEVSDCPMDLLYRWAQVQEERLQEKYLLTLIKAIPDSIKNIVDYLQSQTQEAAEVLLSREKWSELISDTQISGILSVNQINTIRNIASGSHKNGWET